MHIDIVTLFPDVVGGMLHASILGRAQERGLIEIACHQIRDYTTNKQMQVDDYPYGGGMGMVMQAQPLHACWKHVCESAGHRVHTILMTPQGKVYDQADARRLAGLDRFILVCGHYEGIDERFVEECVDEELSIGDFVLTGGEIPAMAIADSVCRLVPGVLADDSCFTEESHWNGLLEYPQFSRPEIWEGRRVPTILLSGHHANIAAWRRKQALRRTLQRRPDLFRAFQPADKQDRRLLEQIRAEAAAAAAAPLLLHCARKADWETQCDNGVYGRAISAADGGLPCSTPAAFAGIAPRFADNAAAYILLVLEAAKLRADVQWQPDTEGTLRPYLCGPLNTDAVVLTCPLLFDDGVWVPDAALQSLL